MQVVVALESRFYRTPDGCVWAADWLGYNFWTRYLDAFDAVRVVARVQAVNVPTPTRVRADGPGVSFHAVPHYKGPTQLAARFFRARRAARRAVERNDAVILRLPGTIAGWLDGWLRAAGHPFAVEVTGDPYEVFAPGSVRSAVRPLARFLVPRAMRRQCAGACAAAYVTEAALQRRYPPAAGAFATSYSSIDLTDDAFVDAPRTVNAEDKPNRILLTGSLEQLYKGPDVLIEAVAALRDAAMSVRLTIVGDGRHRGELEALARDRGIADRVRFAGRLPPGEAIRNEMDQADLFVLPSRTEGLPRVLLEAMARGVPCAASRVGGIPELLDDAELFPPGDAAAVAATLREMLCDPNRLARLSERNLSKAGQFHRNVLTPRRRRFYEAVRNATQAWLDGGAGNRTTTVPHRGPSSDT